MQWLVEGDKEAIDDISDSLRKSDTQVTEIGKKSFGVEVILCSILVPASLAAAQIIHDQWLAKRETGKIIKIYVNGVEISPKDIVVEITKSAK
jgi:hypothetical protein